MFLLKKVFLFSYENWVIIIFKKKFAAYWVENTRDFLINLKKVKIRER